MALPATCVPTQASTDSVKRPPTGTLACSPARKYSKLLRPPEEPGLEHHDDHDGLLEALVRGPLATPDVAAGRLRGVRRTLWRRLGETLHNHNADTQAALDDLFQRALTKDADHRLRRAVRNGSTDDDLATLVTALHRDGQLVINARSGRDPIRIVSSMGVRS